MCKILCLLSAKENRLYLSACQLDDVIYVVRLNFRFMRGFVAVNFAAFGAFMENDVTLFRVGERFYWVHDAAAFTGSVAGVYVNVKRAKAFGAMVARGIAEGQNLKPAVCTDKTVVVFCEKLLFHVFFLYLKRHLWGVFLNM